MAIAVGNQTYINLLSNLLLKTTWNKQINQCYTFYKSRAPPCSKTVHVLLHASTLVAFECLVLLKKFMGFKTFYDMIVFFTKDTEQQICN